MEMVDSLKGSLVLVVEDDQDTRELFSRSLGTLGAQVRSASSAEAALDVLSTWRPDAVLCDLHLPGVDGYSLLARVRANPDLQNLPVIAISGSHPMIERQRSIDAGFAEHLVKPSKLREIVAVMTHVIASAARDAARRS